MIDGLSAAGFLPRRMLVWVKSSPTLVRQSHYHQQHETCLYAFRKGESADWIGDRKQTTVWEIPKAAKLETGHSTQKPLECMERPIRHHKGDVYDPFVGSGTTILAAEAQGRTCYAHGDRPAVL